MLSPQVHHLCQFLQTLAPLHLAEEWDNVGLLVGDPQREIARIMTCLTLSSSTVTEAVRDRASVVVVHHPLPFRPLKKITADTATGRSLLKLIENGIAVYSAHTAMDSAAGGINAQLALKLQLTATEPLVIQPRDAQGLGAGRYGELMEPSPLQVFARRTKEVLHARHMEVVGELSRQLTRVAVACGSGGSFLTAACEAKCDALLTGETNLHTCYEAEACGIALIVAGHYATERFHMEYLADALAREFPQLDVWASRDEREPAVSI